MDKNFRVRLMAGILMFVIAVAGLYTFDSVPFRIIYGLFSLVALVEIMSFFQKKWNGLVSFLAIIQIAFLVGGVAFVAQADLYHFWYVILGVPGYDIFAYLFGKLFGGKIFGKSRPFPHISKNKTWEGTILGLLMSVSLVMIMMSVNGCFEVDWYYLFCGPLALVGDLFESYLKRKFDVKDSNEIVIKNRFFRGIEHLVGGSEGHGGFLDRIDSTAFTATILLLISLVVR